MLLSADYSQVELRILAHISQDESLIETFRRGADIHRATASKMFNIPEDELTAEQRRAAKTINFGVLYGMSAFRLSNELGHLGGSRRRTGSRRTSRAIRRSRSISTARWSRRATPAR